VVGAVQTAGGTVSIPCSRVIGPRSPDDDLAVSILTRAGGHVPEHGEVFDVTASFPHCSDHLLLAAIYRKDASR
jgi:hypothetical protein